MLPTSTVPFATCQASAGGNGCDHCDGMEGSQPMGRQACRQGAFNSWTECKLPMPSSVTPLSAQSARALGLRREGRGRGEHQSIESTAESHSAALHGPN